MTSLLAAFMERFEEEFGYPPGENRLTRAVPDASQAEARHLTELPDDLADFYREVEKLSIPDVDNGLFIHSPEAVIRGIDGTQPTELTGAFSDSIVVFGSDGGGALFALSRTNGRVYRLSGGVFVRVTYEADEKAATVVAQNFAGFLEYVLEMVADSVPGTGT